MGGGDGGGERGGRGGGKDHSGASNIVSDTLAWCAFILLSDLMQRNSPNVLYDIKGNFHTSVRLVLCSRLRLSGEG